MFINTLDWKSHYIKKRTFNPMNANVSNPFLNAVRTSFIIRFVIFKVKMNFFLT